MTRVLFWNIENFGINKIANPSAAPEPGTTNLTQAQASQQRLNYVRDLLTAAKADIVVVIEVSTGNDAPGRLCRDSGLEGSIRLLTEIRNVYNNGWMLVPPLQTGTGEAVSVFYQSKLRYFTGPYLWPGGPAAISTAPGVGATGAYPDELKNRMPDRAIPKDAQHNAKVAENRCAARIGFTYRAGHPHKKQQINWGTTRRPYMVTFAETDKAIAPTVLRDLTLFAIHAPAKYLPAVVNMKRLKNMAEIDDAPAEMEARLVIGDFNLNLMNKAFAKTADYELLEEIEYKLALAPAEPLPASLEGYAGYFATHIRGRNSASCWSSQGKTVYYPGYDYIGSDTIANLYAIDNAYTKHGANANPPAVNNVTILNAIARTPFLVGKKGVQKYGSGPPGTVPMPRLMDWPGPARPMYPPAQGPPQTIGLVKDFRSWDQYGRIRSTSDHLPLVIDI